MNRYLFFDGWNVAGKSKLIQSPNPWDFYLDYIWYYFDKNRHLFVNFQLGTSGAHLPSRGAILRYIYNAFLNFKQ